MQKYFKRNLQTFKHKTTKTKQKANTSHLLLFISVGRKHLNRVFNASESSREREKKIYNLINILDEDVIFFKLLARAHLLDQLKNLSSKTFVFFHLVRQHAFHALKIFELVVYTHYEFHLFKIKLLEKIKNKEEI